MLEYNIIIESSTSHNNDLKTALCSRSINSLKLFQKIIINELTNNDEDKFKNYDFNDIHLLVDRNNGDRSHMLLRYQLWDSNLHSYKNNLVHLFIGYGRTACGLKSGTEVYLYGIHNYCQNCLTANLSNI